MELPWPWLGERADAPGVQAMEGRGHSCLLEEFTQRRDACTAIERAAGESIRRDAAVRDGRRPAEVKANEKRPVGAAKKWNRRLFGHMKAVTAFGSRCVAARRTAGAPDPSSVYMPSEIPGKEK